MVVAVLIVTKHAVAFLCNLHVKVGMNKFYLQWQNSVIFQYQLYKKKRFLNENNKQGEREQIQWVEERQM